jgi:hypothetical protein
MQVLDDLSFQLDLRRAEAALAEALEGTESLAMIGPLVLEYFRRCLAWEAKHGYFGVLRVGGLQSLFPRPPVPRDTVRTWPPFVPYAIGLRAALLAAGDPRGERFFAPIERQLGSEFDPEKVRRGCIEAMRIMMDREQAR